MNWKIVNESVQVGGVQIGGVAASSLILIGDTDNVVLSSMFDTPPESVIVGADVKPMANGTSSPEGDQK